MRVTLASRAFLPDTGGIETSSAMLARLWAEAGNEVTIVTRVPGSTTFQGIPVVRDWTTRSLSRAFRSSDVVVTNGYSRVAAVVSQAFRVPLGIIHQGYQFICSDGLGFRARTFHDFSFVKDLRLALAESPAAAIRGVVNRGFDEVFRRSSTRVLHVVPSEHVRSRLGLPDAVVLYQAPNPGVVDALAAVHPSEGDRANAYRNGPIRFFGRLVFEKGVDNLVTAYAALLTAGAWGWRRTPPTLELHGEGPERNVILEMIARLGLGRQVKVLPFLAGADLVRAAREATVVVIPSRWEEPGATIAVEMFLAGAAVITGVRGATGEIFRDSGRLFENRDAQALAGALRAHFDEGPRYPDDARMYPWTLDAIRKGSLEVLDRLVAMRAR